MKVVRNDAAAAQRVLSGTGCPCRNSARPRFAERKAFRLYVQDYTCMLPVRAVLTGMSISPNYNHFFFKMQNFSYIFEIL